MPGAVARLTEAAGGRLFEHVAARLREERATRAAEAKAAADYTRQGFTVLDQSPASWDAGCVRLRQLVTADNEAADESAVTDPAQWAVLLYEDTCWVDTETGEPVDEQAVDWDTEGDAKAAPSEGLRHADTVTEATVFVPEYFCLDYTAAGLALSDTFQRMAGLSVDDDSPTGAGADDADREAARLTAQAQRVEAEKRERRKVIALNRLGVAAIAVRRQFLTVMLARKTPPKGAGIFVADCLARDQHLLTEQHMMITAAGLLGVDATDGAPGEVGKLVENLPATGDARAQVITLGLVLGALESRTAKDAWRRPAPVSASARAAHCGHDVTSGDYLRWLAANAYPLSAIEEVITGTRSADEAYDEYLAEAARK